MISSANNKGAGTSRRKLRSEKAALQFSVSRVEYSLKKGRYCRRLGATAPVYLAAVLENLVAEVLDMAANVTEETSPIVIKPRHIMLAPRNDVEVEQAVSRCHHLGIRCRP
uniref:Histone H2A.1 n=1 Tax=Lilium longiflorum TaxID=4690 RepID=H2A1_LILLO|nr:RecName: Full=Histone H2A.1; AltName: Full=GcH2A [Lilium longiflorum]CAB40356.1 histone H2A [Lilium longiflorum]